MCTENTHVCVCVCAPITCMFACVPRTRIFVCVHRERACLCVCVHQEHACLCFCFLHAPNMTPNYSTLCISIGRAGSVSVVELFYFQSDDMSASESPVCTDVSLLKGCLTLIRET